MEPISSSSRLEACPTMRNVLRIVQTTSAADPWRIAVYWSRRKLW
jgi:hypothetical protein